MQATKLLKISVIVLGLSFLLLTIYVMQPYYSFYKTQKTDNQTNVTVSPTIATSTLGDVQISTDVPETDLFTLNSANLDDENNLIFEVAYGGGCETHDFDLYWSGEITTNQLTLQLVHDAHDDLCEAYITETRSFELSPIFSLYNDAFTEIIINYGEQTYNLNISDGT